MVPGRQPFGQGFAMRPVMVASVPMPWTRLQLDHPLDTPSISITFGAAMVLHLVMLIWNPTILTGGAMKPQLPLMQVEYRESLPKPIVVPVVKPAVPKVEKKIEKRHAVHKAHKSGLMAIKHRVLPATHHPLPAAHHRTEPAKAISKPRKTIEIPHYVPHSSDDDVISAAHPQAAPPVAAPTPSAGVLHSAPKLVGRTRGVRISDVRFEMAESGTLSGSAKAGSPVVNIPLGEEAGDTAVLPSAPSLHQAAGGGHHLSAGYHPGETGGQLVGRNRGYSGGVIRADALPQDEEASLSGKGKGHGQGNAGGAFEIGGPIGDREIVSRTLPEYPAWAEERGVSAMVKLYFTVRSDGHVRSTIRILRSSGYTELDELAKQALLQWQFSPTTASSTESDSWGTIVFRFMLS